MKQIRVAVFSRPDIPQFLIPGMWENPDGDTSCGLTIDAMMTAIMIGAKYKWYEIPTRDDGTADLPHKTAELIGPQFAHGSITILIPEHPIPPRTNQMMQPICASCHKRPNELAEYVDAAREEPEYFEDADDYVRRQEGTYNPKNGHFLCTECYIKAGEPSSPRGWTCP